LPEAIKSSAFFSSPKFNKSGKESLDGGQCSRPQTVLIDVQQAAFKERRTMAS
jgi:hypothetical protein